MATIEATQTTTALTVSTLPLEWEYQQFFGTRKGLGTWIGTQRMVLISSTNSETWEFDYSSQMRSDENGTWSVTVGLDDSKRPVPRQNAAITSLQVGNAVYALLFGGKSTTNSNQPPPPNSEPGLFGDTWLYYNKAWKLLKYPSGAVQPKHRSKHAMTMIAGTSSVLMFGGSTSEISKRSQQYVHDILNEAWVFTYDKGWTNVTGSKSQTMPPARIDSAMAPIGKKLVLLFAGRHLDKMPHQDTWIYNHSVANLEERWRRVHPATSPRSRTNHAMVDFDDNCVVLYGGTDPRTRELFDDVWIFNRTTNTENWHRFLHIQNVGSPTKRKFPGLARLHSAEQERRMLLFGGQDAENGNDLSDAYVLDFKTRKWDTVTYFVSPIERSHHASAGSFLFGGMASLVDPVMDDTWQYTEAEKKWKRLTSRGHKPPPLYDHAMSTIGPESIVLFGGFRGVLPQGDMQHNDETWILDTSESSNGWHKVILARPKSRPTGRVWHAMAELKYSGGLGGTSVMFGGNIDEQAGSVCGTWLLMTEPQVPEWFWLNIIPDQGKLPAGGTHPKARGGHSMASLGTNNGVVMFGGCSLDTTNKICAVRFYLFFYYYYLFFFFSITSLTVCHASFSFLFSSCFCVTVCSQVPIGIRRGYFTRLNTG